MADYITLPLADGTTFKSYGKFYTIDGQQVFVSHSGLEYADAGIPVPVAPDKPLPVGIGARAEVALVDYIRPAEAKTFQPGQVMLATSARYVFPLARANGGSGTILRVGLRHSNPVAMAARVHLFRSMPLTISADGAAFAGGFSGYYAEYLGGWDVTTDKIFTDGAVGWNPDPVNLPYKCAPASQVFYVVLEVVGAAYASPSGEVFRPLIHTLLD